MPPTTHFLETLPLDFSLPPTRELQGLLARRYYSEALVVELLRKTTLSPADVDLSGSAHRIWYSVLDTARNREKLGEVTDAAREDEAIRRRLDELLADIPMVEALGEAAAPPGALPPESAGEWAGPDDVPGIERLLDAIPTWQDVSFLAKGTQIASAVARLVVRFGNKRGYGTTFRIGDDLLLTNHHVLNDWRNDNRRPDQAIAEFDYELDATGRPKEVVRVECDIDSIVGEKDHDWGVIRAKRALPDRYRVVALDSDAVPMSGDRAFVIQHPKGDTKKVGLVRNLVSYVDDDVVQYLTDTDAGSSGSPVFDSRWNLIALHHCWVPVEPAGEATAFRNQGRRIERVRAGLAAARVDIGAEPVPTAADGVMR